MRILITLLTFIIFHAHLIYADIELIAKVSPKNDAFTGMVDAEQVVAGALPDGMTATTQSANDNSTKLATTAYVDGYVTGFTQGSVIFADSSGYLTQDNSNFYFDDTNDRFAIGSNSTTITVHTVSSGNAINTVTEGGIGSDSAAAYSHFGDSAIVGATFYGSRARTSAASPAIVQSGDVLTEFYGLGFDGTDYEIGAYISFQVDGTPGANDMPGKIVLGTTADGAYTPTDVLTIDSSQNSIFSGDVGIKKTPAGSYVLDVLGNSYFDLTNGYASIINKTGSSADFNLDGNTQSNIVMYVGGTIIGSFTATASAFSYVSNYDLGFIADDITFSANGDMSYIAAGDAIYGAGASNTLDFYVGLVDTLTINSSSVTANINLATKGNFVVGYENGVSNGVFITADDYGGSPTLPAVQGVSSSAFGAEDLLLQPAGSNVGIAKVPNASYRLDVLGQAYFEQTNGYASITNSANGAVFTINGTTQSDFYLYRAGSLVGGFSGGATTLQCSSVVNLGFLAGGSTLFNSISNTSFIVGSSNFWKLTVGSTQKVYVNSTGVAIGNTTSPDEMLHVFKNSAGTVTALANSVITAENNNDAYISILTPDVNERGILFGEASNNVEAGIIYNNSNSGRMDFRLAGNSTKASIDADGNFTVQADQAIGLNGVSDGDVWGMKLNSSASPVSLEISAYSGASRLVSIGGRSSKGGAFNPVLNVNPNTNGVAIGTTSTDGHLYINHLQSATAVSVVKGGQSIYTAFRAYTNSGPHVGIHNNVSSGAWNPLVAAGDNLILFGDNTGAAGSGNLVIAPWHTSSYGIKIVGSTGYVGVDTGSPVVKHQVNSLNGTYNVPYNSINSSISYICGTQGTASNNHSSLLTLLDTSDSSGTGGTGGGITFAGTYKDFGTDYYGAAGRIRAETLTNQYSGHIIFETVNNGVMTEQGRVSHGGNWGFGTNGPTHVVHIAGNGPIVRLEELGTYNWYFGIVNGETSYKLSTNSDLSSPTITVNSSGSTDFIRNSSTTPCEITFANSAYDGTLYQRIGVGNSSYAYNFYFAQNATQSGANWVGITNGFSGTARNFQINGGNGFLFQTATGVTAGGTISWTNQVVINASGMAVGTPTGGNKGVGTINCAGDIYKNNSAYTNPDYALEHYFTGRIIKYALNEGAAEYKGLMPLNRLKSYLQENYRLPGITDEPAGTFKRNDIVLEKLEEAHLYITQLYDENQKIKAEIKQLKQMYYGLQNTVKEIVK